MFQTFDTQDSGRCYSFFGSSQQDHLPLRRSWRDTAMDVVREQSADGFSAAKIKYKNSNETPAERYAFYQQSLLGYPISDAWMRVDCDPEDDRLLGFYCRFFSDKILKRAERLRKSGRRITQRQAVRTAKRKVDVDDESEVRDAEICFRLSSKTPRLSWKIRLFAKSTGMAWVVYVDAIQNRVIRCQSDTYWADQGNVFFPNPMVRTGDYSLRPGDPIPSAAYVSTLIPNLNSSGFLDGTYASTSGTSGRVRRPNGDFRFAAGQQAFGETMAYFYIDWVQTYLKHRLNFQRANPGQVKVTVNGLSGDESLYVVGENRIYLGAGGIPDSNDAEIIVHEYGHAIHSKINPVFGHGNVSLHLAEGFCDYLALSLFEQPKPAAVKKLFGCWDAAGRQPPAPVSDGVPYLRRLSSNQTKLSDFTFPPVGRNNKLVSFWATVLWDIRTKLGSDRGDSIAIGHLYRIEADFSFGKAAKAIIEYNTRAYAGRNESDLRQIFSNRGITVSN